SGTIYDVAVSGMTQSGSVSATIPLGAAHDAAGLASAASTSTDNTVNFVTQADLSITKSAANEVIVGQNLTYTIVVSNAGPSAAQSVSLTDVILSDTTFVSATQTAGPIFVLTTPTVGGTGTFMATAGSLASGASSTFRLVVHVESTAPVGDEI